jgi:uncharacterized membrane protein|tara:strand:+ start:1599 stop:1751 length:153 start_codon:yes stop_codon:yes gene_type:complete
MDITLHIILIVISFMIAFLGVIVLFTVDPWTGLALSVGGIILSIRTIERA